MTRTRRSSLAAVREPPLPTKVKRGGRTLPVVTSTSIAASLRHAFSGEDKTALIDGDISHGVALKRAVCNPRGILGQKGSCLRLQPTTPDLNFWKGICRPALLVHALANIGTLVEADPALFLASSQPRYPFSALTKDRVLTAIQAILDAHYILQHASEKKGDGQYHSTCSSEKWDQVVALIKLAESAVPMKVSILSAAVITSNGATNAFPTTPLLLRERLQSLQRLLRLRESHVHIMTTLRQCKTKSEVAATIFGRGFGGTNDSVEPMPAITSCHQKEQRVIKELMELVNSIAPCSDSWGTAMLLRLRVAGGSYIFHRQSRCETLASLLSVAEFFGLPPFLRSIRIARGCQGGLQSQSATTLPVADGHTRPEVNLPHSIFFLPSDLDSRCFDKLAPNQAQVVHEELIDLACRHCRFGALVGEADQIVTLLNASAAPQRQARAEGRGEQVVVVGEAEGAGGNLLCSYAESLTQATNDEGENKNVRVRWLCSNCWSPTMSYYALVIATVPSHIDDEVVWNMEKTKGDEEGRSSMSVPYYIAAVLELTRL